MNIENPGAARSAMGIVVLGCDKNTADAEHFAGVLARRLPPRIAVVGLAENAEYDAALEAVVIFTCAFVEDAKTESIETILFWTGCKQEKGNPRKVYVAGCLSQRYADELRREIPEVDGFIRLDELETLVEALWPQPAPKPADAPTPLRPRQRLDTNPHAFLKICDGCNHACTFCVIPGIKGPLQSTPREMLLDEARALVASGVREINLVAQDTTAYGRDLYEDYRLADLLADLCALPGDFWIRCLYCYPGGLDDRLIRQIADQPKIVPYLDVPLQHASPAILRAMQRPAAGMDLDALITRLRAAIPGLALRTTMMVGFPGETEADHQILLDTIGRLKFEWLGAFRFCPEEDAPASRFPDQVPADVVQERYDALMNAQAEITERFNVEREGRVVRALVEHYDAAMQAWIARSPAEAPEVDGVLLLNHDAPVQPGQFVEVRLLCAALYDITATTEMA